METRGLFLTFFALVMVVRGKLECLSPEKFETDHNASFIESYQSYKDTEPGLSLHRFLLETGDNYSSPKKNKVYFVYNYFKHTGVRRMFLDDEKKNPEAEREVKTLRGLCEMRTYDVSDKYVCKHSFIAGYYGCVVDEKAVYLFQEYWNDSLFSSQFLASFQELPPFKRVEVMLDIIDKFIELHRIGIVHSDIRPFNIIFNKDSRLSFKITGFKYANPQGGAFLGGTPGYLAPERDDKSKLADPLSFTEDVFSLAMTLVEMEAHSEFLPSIPDQECFQDEEKPSDCKSKIFAGLDKIFNEERGLISLLGVFRTALNSDANVRFPTMKKFSLAIIEEFRKLEGAETNEKLPQNGQIHQGFWRNQIRCTNFSSNRFTRVVSDIAHYVFSPKDCDKDENSVVASTGNAKQQI